MPGRKRRASGQLMPEYDGGYEYTYISTAPTIDYSTNPPTAVIPKANRKRARSRKSAKNLHNINTVASRGYHFQMAQPPQPGKYAPTAYQAYPDQRPFDHNGLHQYPSQPQLDNNALHQYPQGQLQQPPQYQQHLYYQNQYYQTHLPTPSMESAPSLESSDSTSADWSASPPSIDTPLYRAPAPLFPWPGFPNHDCPRLVRTSKLDPPPGPHAVGRVRMAASLRLMGDLNSMMADWSPSELQSRRRLVWFRRFQTGSEIHVEFGPDQGQPLPPGSFSINCIWWEEREACVLTSVDLLKLLERILASHFPDDEKNRIRRNVDNISPMTVYKSKPETANLFKVIMGLPEPKPRNIEKAIKVSDWKNLIAALLKVVGKYSTDSVVVANYYPMAGNMTMPMQVASNYTAGVPMQALSTQAIPVQGMPMPRRTMEAMASQPMTSQPRYMQPMESQPGPAQHMPMQQMPSHQMPTSEMSAQMAYPDLLPADFGLDMPYTGQVSPSASGADHVHQWL